MCLGQLAECVAVPGDGTARVRIGDADHVASLLTFDGEVAPGDWLVVHSGYVLERIGADEAEQARRIRAAECEETS